MGDQPVSKGRATALMAAMAALKKKQAETQQVGATASSTSVEEAPRPRGRAALLQRYASKVGGPPTSEPQVPAVPQVGREVQEVTRKVESISLSEAPPVSYKGTGGKEVPLSANYIRLKILKDCGIFEYEVRFQPDLDAKSQRIRLVNNIMKELNNVKVFDGGSVLYLPQQIIENQKEIIGTLSGADGDQKIKVIIKFKKKKPFGDCLHLYNILFKRIMRKLLFTQMGRNYFDTHHKYIIPQHKLEIYPGFAVNVDEKEDGLMICLDTQHRVLRTQNVLELFNDLLSAFPRNQFTAQARSAIVGSCVFTRYNNKTYIVDDVNFEWTPKMTFKTHDGSKISFVEYYKKQYNLDIEDLEQPLLIHRQKLKGGLKPEEQSRLICLIPELSYLTGLTDNMRNDFKVMKDVAQYTRVTPNQRINAMRKYIENVRNSEDAQNVLKEWGLCIDTKPLDLTGRQLEPETVYFGNGDSYKCDDTADWNSVAGRKPLNSAIDLTKWVLFYTQRDERSAKEFVQLITRLGPTFGCRISPPNVVLMRDDRTETYMEICKRYLEAPGVQIAVFICPTMRSDRYTVIKKMCCVQIPIASQVILGKTLSNEKKIRGITTKIAMQMNCKLGGSLWTLRFPFKKWMICGIDVYHDQSKRESVCGFVASINESLTKWFSVAIFQKQELGDAYTVPFSRALEMFLAETGSFPEKIIIYRDGTGDGQLEQSRKYEVEQFENILKQFKLNAKLLFIVVQKRINTKLYGFSSQGPTNPAPGTIMDHSVTRRHLEDFFLVAQNVRQGTVNPTHYIILHDTCNLPPDRVQKLSYKLCHLYYNWPGTVRVPAPCLYAHKLAGLVGQYIKKTPNTELSNKLFYL